jgi:hypothetical protein
MRVDFNRFGIYEEVYRLDIWYVLSAQPHITKKELDEAFDKYI